MGPRVVNGGWSVELNAGVAEAHEDDVGTVIGRVDNPEGVMSLSWPAPLASRTWTGMTLTLAK